MTCGVYMILHKESGKIYIGSSVDIPTRWTFHKSGYGKQVVHRAIKKYGPEAFDWSVLEECGEEMLIEREQAALDYHRPFGKRGYNIREIAERNTGVRLSAETRRKMSLARKGKPKSPETRAKMRRAARGRDMSHLKEFQGLPVSEESKRKISEANRGNTWADDVERVRRHSEQRRGKKHSVDHVEKVRQANLGKKRDADFRQALSDRQQRTYVAISPEGKRFDLRSRDLIEWLPAHNLNRPNFCKAANTGKLYKGWAIIKS